MTDGQLRLDPVRARRAAVDLAAAGRAMTGARRTLGESLATTSGQRPWGRDDIGAAFDEKYQEYEAMVLQIWQRLGGYVEGLGAAVARSVQASVQTDAVSARRVHQAGEPR